ncbi:acetoacetyl-CoA reductase [Trinickia sp. LjRoot230]|uniref:acetoacetyl-CoA reductase n=1 Tax=Trinickia sp. LjRoot230 TaxID=3342288 RepID=UPI003ECF1CA2
MTRKVALVTGGMGGIGEAISTRLHDVGHTVIVTYSPNNANADKWLASMDANGRQFRAYAVDVADYASCERCAQQIRSEIGQIDILVNNAGITRDASFKKLDKDSWDAVLRTNLDSIFNMTKQWYEGMTTRGWGRIINISSVIGCKGGFGQTNYAAAKAGMHGFTKSLALELARKGVTVNTVSPGFIATRMVMAVPEEVLQTKILPEIPVGRLGRPEEVAALIAYLCSEEAGFVTGANISINGGQHLQ